jgi:hypothetical protein
MGASLRRVYNGVIHFYENIGGDFNNVLKRDLNAMSTVISIVGIFSFTESLLFLIALNSMIPFGK